MSPLQIIQHPYITFMCSWITHIYVRKDGLHLKSKGVTAVAQSVEKTVLQLSPIPFP